jgi:hypothetical protein
MMMMMMMMISPSHSGVLKVPLDDGAAAEVIEIDETKGDVTSCENEKEVKEVTEDEKAKLTEEGAKE